MIVLKGVKAGYGKRIVVEADVEIDGKFIGVIGPNGSGKTTLLKVIAGILKPISGRVFVNGTDVHKEPKRVVSRIVTLVSQDFAPVYDFKVLELVKMAFSSSSIFPSPDEDEKALAALKKVGMEGFADRFFSTLSGGEKRLVMLARAIAQETDVVLVDELELHLDPNHKKRIAEILEEIAKNGKTVISVFHDVQLATSFSESFLLVDKGKVLKKERLDEEDLEEIFGVEFRKVDGVIIPWY